MFRRVIKERVYNNFDYSCYINLLLLVLNNWFGSNGIHNWEGIEGNIGELHK